MKLRPHAFDFSLRNIDRSLPKGARHQAYAKVKATKSRTICFFSLQQTSENLAYATKKGKRIHAISNATKKDRGDSLSYRTPKTATAHVLSTLKGFPII
ncbi:hypothetical protein [Alloprevotella tannerae]|uniref:hypothetical protein n=1 Tax=Alloprevotella tannerae TaxID=76122 RepID=UPI0028E1D21F|nr:hypothetical protein [Alloprevotella tannerae]